MCSRFNNEGTPQQLARRFGAWHWPESRSATTYRPTDSVPCIDQERGPWLARWGLTVRWSPKPLINARLETLHDKKLFRPMLQARCLVPATFYLEWRKDGAARRRNVISLADGGLFAMAGLTDGANLIILTRAATPEVAHIHHRMPVILPAHFETTWISRNANPEQAVSALRDALSEELGFEMSPEEDPIDRRQLPLL